MAPQRRTTIRGSSLLSRAILGIEEVDISSLEKDLGKRFSIWKYPVDQHDKIHRAYINVGPYQPKNIVFPTSTIGKHHRQFQPSWYNKFPSWLEYSPHKDVVFCLPCYLFNNNHDQSQHIEKVFDKQSAEIIAKNRLRLKTSIDVVRWFTFQACAFRGNDESLQSLNRGNFIELVNLMASYSSKVANVVLEKAPGNAQYISPSIQKEILYIFARRVRVAIREEIEQIAIVLRFMDKDGHVQERFFDLIHVVDTSSLTLKKQISSVLSRHCLDIQNLHGQGYNGASNMRGEWNGLQALFLKDCPYALYSLSCSSPTTCSIAHATIIANLIASDDIETSNGLNQIGTLQRTTDTRWGSHLNFVRSLLCMFDATCEVLQNATEDGNYSLRGNANSAYDILTSFEFFFFNQDILNVMSLVSTTKSLLQRMRESSWDGFFKEVESFCEKHEIIVPHMTTLYIPRRVEHYYRINLFIATPDTQLHELNNRFCDNMVELLTLSSTLDPKDLYKSLDMEKICDLATKFYPDNFTGQDKLHLRIQAQHYELDGPFHSELKNLSTICELCQGLTMKNKLRNKMEDEFLAGCLITYIERKITEKFDINSIIDEFYDMKKHHARL
ncbi:hypothetical protein GLYMA_14G133900v4 [Glycine max]|uniref:TTF-type domain-containing protein n=1 Tax=Glycine max TaxID=3847 RepID=A0A0R0GCQ3_SOYBN|nr:hypothetical protein GLYMA_14G133900v4 [Glycine max]